MRCKELLTLVLASAGLVQGAGCSAHATAHNRVDLQTAGRLQAGTSVDDVTAMLGSEGEFGFLVQTDRGEQLGLEFRVGSRKRFVFVFEDDSLRSIVPYVYPKSAVREREDGTRISKAIPAHPDERVSAILMGDSYFGEKLVASCKKRQGPSRISIPNNLIPAIVACMICPGIAVVAAADELEHPNYLEECAQSRRHWSYKRIDFGMTEQDVELVFGESKLLQEHGPIRGCLYGDRPRGSRMVVEYHDGRVHAMYGKQFGPFDWNGELREALFLDGYKRRDG